MDITGKAVPESIWSIHMQHMTLGIGGGKNLLT